MNFLDTHDWTLELSSRANGAALGSFQMRPDGVRLAEATRLALLRGGRRDAFTDAVSIRIEPERPAGRTGARITGVRTTACCAGEDLTSSVVGIDFFATEADVAARRLMGEGLLKDGELYEYRVTAQPGREPASPPAGRVVVRPRVAAVPLVDGRLSQFLPGALQIGDAETGDLPIFIGWHVLEEISVLTRRAGALETGGVLIGQVHVDSELPEAFVEVTAQIPADAPGTLTRLPFTASTWQGIEARQAPRRPGECWAGWWHSHSFQKNADAAHLCGCGDDARPFLSAEDLRLTRAVFPRAFSVALLVTDAPRAGISWAAFGWKDGVVSRRGFHAIKIPGLSAAIGGQPFKQGEDHAA